MVISLKNVIKLVGISIVACCAVIVCILFLNFYMDAKQIEHLINSEEALIFYNAQIMTAKVVCFVSGGCLLATSVVMLVFYIKHYIDTHKKELGIMKALGYSDIAIAKNFWIFGLSVLVGTVIGFAVAFCIMPSFYVLQNKDKILPEMAVNFHPSLCLYFIVLPTVAFALISILYAFVKLKRPLIYLLKDTWGSEIKRHGKKRTNKNTPFICDIKRSTLTSKKILSFFVIFASFCFSSMMQMSASMKDLSSKMMGAMMFIIGMTLAFTTLFIALLSVVRGNTKTIAMMRVFGYSQNECSNALLGGYRPLAYIGFAIGTVYQYILLKIMVEIVFRDIGGVSYSFDFNAMLFTLLIFVVAYELIMYFYSKKIKKVSIKEIMIN